MKIRIIEIEKNNLSRQKDLIYNLTLALLYFLSGKVSFFFFYQDKIVTLSAFLPAGFALAAVLIYGPRIIPGILLGQFVLSLDAGLSFIPSLGIALVKGIEALLAVFLARQLHLDIHLRSIRDILLLTLMIFFILQPISSLLGIEVLHLAPHQIHSHYFRADLFHWWFGNSMGQLLLTPLLLMLYTWHPRPHYLLLGFISVITVLLNYLLQVLLGIHNLALLMLITLPLLIHLSTINLRYALTAAVALDLSSLIMIHYGEGVFVQAPTLRDSLLNLNFFVLSTLLLVLIVGTLFREKEEAIRELKLTHFDPLTGALNRRQLDRKIREGLKHVQDFQTISALCYLDLDRFKVINDTYGHSAGDQVLKEVTYRIRHFLREYDQLIRVGGDEFILILNHLHRIEELQKILDRILKALAKPLSIHGESYQVTASIGAVLITPEFQDPEELLQIADITMYQAKKQGRNRYFIAQREFRRDQRSIAKP